MSYFDRVKHSGRVVFLGMAMAVLLSSCGMFKVKCENCEPQTCGPTGPGGEWMCPKTAASCGATCGAMENRMGCNNNPSLTCRTIVSGGACDCKCVP
jgi:hypothetical protein